MRHGSYYTTLPVLFLFLPQFTERIPIGDKIGKDKCYLLKANLAEKNAAVKLWQEAIAWRNHIDILVNNAGIFVGASVEDEMDIWANAWQETLQVNLIAVADLCREAIRHFQTRNGGTIINIASRAAFRGDDPQHIHYAASKGGVISMTRTIRHLQKLSLPLL